MKLTKVGKKAVYRDKPEALHKVQETNRTTE